MNEQRELKQACSKFLLGKAKDYEGEEFNSAKFVAEILQTQNKQLLKTKCDEVVNLQQEADTLVKQIVTMNNEKFSDMMMQPEKLGKNLQQIKKNVISTRKKIVKGKNLLNKQKKNLKNFYFNSHYNKKVLEHLEKVSDLRKLVLSIENHLQNQCIYEASIDLQTLTQELEKWPKDYKETVVIQHLLKRCKQKRQDLQAAILQYLNTYIFMTKNTQNLQQQSRRFHAHYSFQRQTISERDVKRAESNLPKHLAERLFDDVEDMMTDEERKFFNRLKQYSINKQSLSLVFRKLKEIDILITKCSVCDDDSNDVFDKINDISMIEEYIKYSFKELDNDEYIDKVLNLEQDYYSQFCQQKDMNLFQFLLVLKAAKYTKTSTNIMNKFYQNLRNNIRNSFILMNTAFFNEYIVKKANEKDEVFPEMDFQNCELFKKLNFDWKTLTMLSKFFKFAIIWGFFVIRKNLLLLKILAKQGINIQNQDFISQKEILKFIFIEMDLLVKNLLLGEKQEQTIVLEQQEMGLMKQKSLVEDKIDEFSNIEMFVLQAWRKSMKISYLNTIYLTHIIRVPLNLITNHIIKIAHTVNLGQKEMLETKSWINGLIDKTYYSKFFKMFNKDYKQITLHQMKLKPSNIEEQQQQKPYQKWSQDLLIKGGLFPQNVRFGELQQIQEAYFIDEFLGDTNQEYDEEQHFQPEEEEFSLNVLTNLQTTNKKQTKEVKYEEEEYEEFNYQLPAVKTLVENLSTFNIIKKKIPKDQMHNLLQILIWTGEVIYLESKYAIESLSRSSFAQDQLYSIKKNQKGIWTQNPIYQSIKNTIYKSRRKRTLFSHSQPMNQLDYYKALQQQYKKLFLGENKIKPNRLLHDSKQSHVIASFMRSIFFLRFKFEEFLFQFLNSMGETDINQLANQSFQSIKSSKEEILRLESLEDINEEYTEEMQVDKEQNEDKIKGMKIAVKNFCEYFKDGVPELSHKKHLSNYQPQIERKDIYENQYKYKLKSGIVRLVELIKQYEELLDKCYTILKLDVHGICFAYLYKSSQQRKLNNFNMQEVWLMSQSYQTFFRELSIYMEQLNERFMSQPDNLDQPKKTKKLLKQDIIFDDIIFVIGKIFKENLMKTDVFTKDLAKNQKSLISLLEENYVSQFHQEEQKNQQIFEYLTPIKNLLSMILKDEIQFMQELEVSQNPPTLEQIKIVLKRMLNQDGEFFSKEEFNVKLQKFKEVLMRNQNIQKKQKSVQFKKKQKKQKK